MAIPITLRTGTLFATIAPGYQGAFLTKGKGVAAVRRDLATDIERLATYGICRLVTTMSAEDIIEDGLGGLLTELEGHGIDWSHLPFPGPDLRDESFHDHLRREVSIIRGELLENQKIALHAKGWGRLLERRIATVITMADDSISEEKALSMATAAVRTGHAILPF